MIVQCKLIANRSVMTEKSMLNCKMTSVESSICKSRDDPFARTGGWRSSWKPTLALEKTGVDVRILCPLHKCCEDSPIKIFKKNIIFNNGTSKITSKIGIWQRKYAVLFIFLSTIYCLIEMASIPIKKVITLTTHYALSFSAMLRHRLKQSPSGNQI